MAAANIKLPKIPHSGLHRQTDIDGLRLTGNALIEGKKYGKAAGPKPGLIIIQRVVAISF